MGPSFFFFSFALALSQNRPTVTERPPTTSASNPIKQLHKWEHIDHSSQSCYSVLMGLWGVLVSGFHPGAFIFFFLLLTHLRIVFILSEPSRPVSHSSFSCLSPSLRLSVCRPLLTPTVLKPLALKQCRPRVAICYHFLLLPGSEHTRTDTHRKRHTAPPPYVRREK